jgi:heme iron utilization protein
LLAAVRTGALATLSSDPAGFPFGSLVAYAVDDLGRPLLCLSDLAEHARNTLALARVTVIGSVCELHDDAWAAALCSYRERHPGAFYAAFDDFRLYRLDVVSVRYVGGFGRMSWVTADDHAAAAPDPLDPHVAGIVGHMNDDHADALVAYCRVFGGRPATERAEMVGVDRYGFTMLALDAGASERTAVRIPWGRRVDTVGEVRAATIALLREARG